MKIQLYRVTLYSIIVYLTIAVLNPSLAVSSQQDDGEPHFCGVGDLSPGGHPLNQFPNRRYARTLANLDVGEPRTVRLIYFLPTDWPYRAEVVQKMKDTIRSVQTFYAEQMEAHGYGKLTFSIESNPQGEPLVHRVDGKHPFSHYDNTLGGKVIGELGEAFDSSANIYFIVLGADVLRQSDGQSVGGVAFNKGKNGGMFVVPGVFSWEAVAHELGHCFGLGHDFRNGAYIMSYGQRQNQLSVCAAEFLSMHTYFNPNVPIEVGEPPTIELVSARRYPSGSRRVPVRFQVSDPQGVHQVLLSAVGGLYACRELEGNNKAIVEFEYDGGFGREGFTSLSDSMGHTIWVYAVDREGNKTWTDVTIVETSPHHIGTLEGHTDLVHSVSFSRDGLLASAGWDRTIRLWDVATRRNIATLQDEQHSVKFLAFSPDGTLASGFDRTIMLWDIAARQRIAILETPWRRANNISYGKFRSFISFSPDGKTLASGPGDGTVRLWDVDTRQHIASLPHGDRVFSVSFSRAGILASGGADRTVKLWDVDTRQHIATLPQNDSVESVTFSPDGGILASAGASGEIELWDVPTKSPFATLTHGGTVYSVSFSADGETLASGGSDDTVKLWDMTTRVNFATFWVTSTVYTVSFSPDGRTIASGTDEGTIETWDTSKLSEVRLEGMAEVDVPDTNLHAAIAEALGLSPNSSILRGHLWALIELDADNANITDLTGLEHAINLKTLNLGSEYIEADGQWVNSNSVSDLSPLTGLTKLASLNLYDSDISDISALSGLISLRVLHLGENSISDISAVAGLSSLTELYLSHNSISDISAVAGLSSLTDLTLQNNDISDISALSGLISLRSLILDANSISDILAVAGLSSLTELRLARNSISDISAVAGLSSLMDLDLSLNSISDISAAAGLTNLRSLWLTFNNISDLAPLVENTGLGSNDTVLVPGNPLSYASLHTHIPTLQERGVEVGFDNRTPQRIRIVSGNDQQGPSGAKLEEPFTVEVQDEIGVAFEGVPVTFTITAGGGTLSTTSVTTNSKGQAESALILGPNPGTNTVTVSVTGIQGQQTFSAEGIQAPKTLAIVSGDDQQGLPGEALTNPFVVEVRDQADEPLSGAEVAFSVTGGEGMLSATSVTTNSKGQAESTLTLGPNPGTNTVTVSVIGIQAQQTFSAKGIRIPKTLRIISGDDQWGQPGTALENPFVAEVQDQFDKPLSDVQVSFLVTRGGGTLSATSATTDNNGRAESTLTLGPNTGTNTVTVSVTGIQGQQTFNAEGIRIPLAFWIISGFGQQGRPGTTLKNPFVVEARARTGEPLAGVRVMFSVASGGGALSITSAMTDGNGQAESTLTLGANEGTNTVTVSVTGIQKEQTVTAIAKIPLVPQDVNMDDVVNILDLVSVASNIGDEGADLAADVNGDGVVNILDLVMVAGAIGGAGAAPSAHELEPLTADEVRRWLIDARSLVGKDAMIQKGIVILEQLLATLTPTKTALLLNFPNPFNPETWIPYQLAESANVTLTIHDSAGAVVRRIDLGHQSAGYYTERTRAAYWDGRNASGETVASGLYFYQLATPSYRQLRRMVILK